MTLYPLVHCRVTVCRVKARIKQNERPPSSRKEEETGQKKARRVQGFGIQIVGKPSQAQELRAQRILASNRRRFPSAGRRMNQ